MNHWMEENDRLILTLNEDVLKSGEAALDETAASFFEFSPDLYEKRVILFFEGREFPSYVESDGAYGQISWSKALLSRILGDFPDYEEYFKQHKDEENAPQFIFEEESEGVYLTRLILPWAEGLEKKQLLFDAVGIGDETGNFEDAYEIFFLKSFFEDLSNRGQSDAFMIAGKLKKYFTARQREYGEQDRNAVQEIENIDEAGLDVILSFLMEGPYKKYTDMGIMNLKRADDHFFFALTPELIDEISTDDKNFLANSLEAKLEAYFDRQDAPSLSDSLQAWMSDYASYFGKDFRYSFKDIVLQAVPAGIDNTGIFPQSSYRSYGFAGVDTWAPVPYVSVQKKKNAESKVSYILDKDRMRLYLTVSIDPNEIEKALRKKGITSIDAIIGAIQQTADTLREALDAKGFDSEIAEVTLEDEKLKKAILFYKLYEYEVPKEENILEDLKTAYEILEEIDELGNETEETEEEESSQEDLAESVDVEDIPSEDVDLSEPEREDTDKTEEVGENVEESDADSEETQASEETLQGPVETIVENSEVKEQPEEGEQAPGDEIEERKEAPPIEVENPILKAVAQTKTVIASHERKPQEKAPVSEVIQKAAQAAKQTVKPVEVKSEPKLETYKPLRAEDGLLEIKKRLASLGYPVQDEDLQNIYLSLLSTPLIGLYGGSARERDQFARAFAASIGAKNRFGQIRMRNQENPFNLLFGSKQEEGILERISAQAKEHPELPYVLYLKDLIIDDEQDVLGELIALLDSRSSEEGFESDPINAYRPAQLAENVILLVSPMKRGNKAQSSLRHLSMIRLPEIPMNARGSRIHSDKLFDASFFKPEAIHFSVSAAPQETLGDVVTLIDAMNTVLVKADAAVDHAVLDEILLYLYENQKKQLMRQERALDYVLTQKVLPAISGSGENVESALIDLFKICAGTQNELAARSYKGQGGLFPMTAGALASMIERLDTEGSTSIL